MNDRSDQTGSAGEATAMERTPENDSLGLQIETAKQRIEAGDLQGGLEAFRSIAESHPQIPEVFNNLGAICAAMNRRDEAEAAFGRATELTPDSPNPWYNRGLMRFQSGNFLGALEDFRRASTIDPGDPEFLNNQGVVYFQLQEWDEARDCFAKALEVRSDYLAASLNLVDVDLAEAKFEAAYERCRELATATNEPDVAQKLVECSIAVATAAVDRAQADCEQVQAGIGDNEALSDRSGRLLRAKQILTGEAPLATDPIEV